MSGRESQECQELVAILLPGLKGQYGQMLVFIAV